MADWTTGTYIVQGIALLMSIGGLYFFVTGLWQYLDQNLGPMLAELEERARGRANEQ